MQRENVIILKLKDKSLFWEYIDKIPVKRFFYKSYLNFFMKVMIKLNFDTLIYGDWKKNIKDYTHIIIFDEGYKASMGKYIKKRNKDCKIIFYYWNPIMENNKE